MYVFLFELFSLVSYALFTRITQSAVAVDESYSCHDCLLYEKCICRNYFRYKQWWQQPTEGLVLHYVRISMFKYSHLRHFLFTFCKLHVFIFLHGFYWVHISGGFAYLVLHNGVNSQTLLKVSLVSMFCNYSSNNDR